MYDAYNSYMLAKGFGVCKDKTCKSRTDGKIIRRQFVCSKEGHKKCHKRSERHEVLFPQDTRWAGLGSARMDIVLNDTMGWVLVKLVA